MEFEELEQRLLALESAFLKHLGVKSGETSFNTPHSGIPYLNSSDKIELDVIPTGTSATTVALGNHTH